MIDKKIKNLIKQELIRQQNGLEMIPSENYVSQNVLKTLGSILTNKYSEGYPNKRYYGGNQYIDEIEKIAIDRAKKLFGFSHANVQSYSGSPANQAIYMALLEPGDKVMGLGLLFGGHLTHGWKVNFSGIYYNPIPYPTDKSGWLDYDEIEKIALREKPKMIFAGATAYPRKFDYKKFKQIADKIEAYLVADISHISGLIIANEHPSPSNYADIVMTTTHKTLRGPRGAIILCNGKPSNPLKKCEKTKENLPSLIDRAVFPGLQGGPHNHQTAAIAVALAEADTDNFKNYAKQVVLNAKALAKELISGGLNLITGGTDNHLILADVTPLGISGKQAENVLDKINITINKNTIPFDTRKPFDPSGIRLGTPALTTRGMKEKEMKIIGQLMIKSLTNINNEKIQNKIKNEILELTKQFPIYK